MKKFLKITFIILAVLAVLIVAVPFVFQGKIVKIAKEQINKNINARADFDKLHLSLIKSFPNVSISLKSFYIAGLDEFEKDTLLKFNSLDITVDLISAVKMENIRIRKIIIDKPRVFAHVLPSGKVNWDITKPATGEETDTSAGEYNTKIELKRFEIIDGELTYADDSSKLSASTKNLDFLLTGDLSQDFSKLDILASGNTINVVMDGIRYLKDASLKAKINVDADLKNSLYTLKENEISLNDLLFKFDGNVGMPNEEDINFDLKYGLAKADFKSILSLVPAIYMKDFEGLKASGKLQLNGYLKGTYNEKMMPNAGVKLLVQNAGFSYPGLPRSAENIQVDMDGFYDGRQMDNSTLDVNKFHAELGGNPVDLTLNIKTPESDMKVNGNLKCDLDLATVKDVIPLDSTVITGKIKAAIDMMGYMSYIEKEKYEKFKADGNLTVTDFRYRSPDLPKELRIIETSLSFTPKYAEVKSFNAVMGKSDFNLSGRVENYIPYLFKDETIKGDFILTSGVLDLNEFMEEPEGSVPEETDTVPMTVVEVPGNIDFKLVSRIDKLYYDKLELENTIGTITVKDSRVILDNIKTQTLDGSMLLNGEYNAKDIKNPAVDFGIQAVNIDIPLAYEAMNLLRQFAPIAKKMQGKVSIGFNFSSFLDETMMPRLSSVTGKGNLMANTVGLKSSDMFRSIGNALNTKFFDNMTFNALAVKFELRNGRVFIDPFETKVGKSVFLIAGEQGIDQTMDYGVNMTLPRTELGQAANTAITNLYSKASVAGLNITPSENINMSARITGTFKDPKVSLNLKDNVKQTTEAIKEEVTKAAKEEIDKRKEEARAAAKAEADKILQEAQKQADAIRKKADEGAAIVKKEAALNGDKMVKQAKDPISKRVAEEAAKKLNQEADEEAQKIIKEANAKANALMKEAQVKADKLLQ
jgi:AsmA-like C-terminal region/AsmA family